MPGAPCPLIRVPTNIPSAQNGSTPSMPVSSSAAAWVGLSVTCPSENAIASNSRMTTPAAAMAISILPSRYAPGGIGSARLKVSRPPSRSSASDTPKPNRPGLITPNTP